MYEQYLAWKALKEEFGDQGFDVLAVPCNNFGLQEPGDNDNILDGIKHVRPGGGFEPNYRVAGKLEVNGANENPLYTFIKARCPNPQNLIADTEQIFWSPVKQNDITWNYEKILVDHEGKPYKRYVPAINPQNNNVRNDIQYLLERRNAALAGKVQEEEVKEVKKERKDKKHNLSEILNKALHH